MLTLMGRVAPKRITVKLNSPRRPRLESRICYRFYIFRETNVIKNIILMAWLVLILFNYDLSAACVT